MAEYPYPEPEPQPVPQAQTSTLAVVSLVAGIVSWVMFPLIGAIVAVVTGHMAKREIRESMGRLTGDGLATVGLILGYLQLALAILGLCGFLLMVLLGIPLFCVPFGNQFGFVLQSFFGY
jgi:hypothetical protein